MKTSVVVVSIIAFLSFFGATLLVSPNLPPGEILYGVLRNFSGIPEITYSILGFTGQALVNGILNGVSWGLLITIIFYLGNRASKREVIVIPVAAPTPVPTPAPVPIRIQHQEPARKTFPESRTFASYVSLDKDVEVINGIGPKYGNRLKFSGVEALDDLLREGSTWKGRRYLAGNVGVSINKINRWVNQADFFRIKGIGKQYADLLDVAGVNTVIDLSKRNPMTLYEKLKETNWERNLVERIPPYRLIKGWVQSAKKLEPRVNL